MKTSFFVLVIVVLLQSCSCGCGSMGKGSSYKIAIDPEFFPVNFKEKEPFVLGYTEEILLEISKASGVKFELISMNWDNLFSQLKKDEYEGVLSSLPPYIYNRAVYDFSDSFFDFGPVLVVPKNSKAEDLSDLNGKIVGLLKDSSGVYNVQKYPEIIIRSFSSTADVFMALSGGSIDAIVVDKIDAIDFVSAYYYDQMKIIDESLTSQALRLITLKDQNQNLLRVFNKALMQLKKKSSYKTLLKKWDLSVPK